MANSNTRFPFSTQRLRATIMLLAFAWILLPAPALAKDYKVEVLIFENLGEHPAYESYHYRQIDDMSSASETWLLRPTMLLAEATALNNSENYRLLSSHSWGQESLPFSQAAAIQIIENDIQGWIKIYANHLLYANLDLDFNGYRMQEKRRLKLDEKHFFDHPKFGLLLQVSRLESAEESLQQPFEENRASDAGEQADDYEAADPG